MSQNQPRHHRQSSLLLFFFFFLFKLQYYCPRETKSDLFTFNNIYLRNPAMALSAAASSSAACTAQTYHPSHSPSRSLLTFKLNKFTPPYPSKSRSPSIHCTLTKQHLMVEKEVDPAAPLQRPDSFGRFGKFGGKYVPETLMHALTELEAAFKYLATSHEFQVFLFFHLLFGWNIEYLRPR